jgi:lipoprotein-anchoring transpeptidase ErfK/SrfK
MWRKRLEHLAFLGVGLAVAAVVLAGVNRLEQGDAGAARATAGSVAKRPFRVPDGNAVIAKANVARVPVYSRPNGRPKLVLPNPNAQGGRLVFLVRWTNAVWTWPDWVRVYLPSRPNGSTGWIRSSQVTFLLDPYHVVVHLRTHSLEVLKAGRVQLRTPIGVGRSVTPTPRGRYYIVQLIITHEPNGLYGPYAFGTSAFSNVLTSFGGGPGQIGIHGTNYPEGIGTDVSHGCIRMPNRTITYLARVLPLGTPVDIVS